MTLPERVDVLIVGSGFAGSLLARGLVEMGLEVLVLDRGRHPRFALGESTTPLGNLALERLALRFGWRDVWDLACWGRWRKSHPDLRCGLKRGFSFFAADDSETRPALIAASPNDEVADTQWLRADVDAALCQRARDAGVVVLEQWEVATLELGEPVRACLRPVGDTATHEVRANFLVDGSGAGRLLEGHVGGRQPAPLDTSLIFGHLSGLPRIESPPRAPYPPTWSAVHHLLDIGWMYELRFDDDVTSCGVIVDRQRCRELDVGLPETIPGQRPAGFASYLPEASGLRERLQVAEPEGPLRWLDQVGWRVHPVVGANWARLPHSVGFIDPMFSTGIAWSLLGVERLLDVLAPDLEGSLRAARLKAYGDLVDREFDHVAGLLEGARATWSDVEALGWFSMVYFTAASFAETQQRLEARRGSGLFAGDEDLGWAREAPWAWSGFLGTNDPVLREALGNARRVASGSSGSARVRAFERHLPDWIEPRNVAGLACREKHPWYGVDLEPLMRNCDRLGLRPEQVEAGLPRLLGEVEFDALCP